MAKYVSVPTEIEAEQFISSGLHTIFPVGMHKWPDENGMQPRDMSWGFVITSNGNRAHVWHGDYIIKEPDGCGYYPCKSDIFEKRYRKID